MPERRKKMKNTTIPIFPHHILKDGRKVILTSNHGFKFSDGTEFKGVPDGFPLDFLNALTVRREFREVSAALPNRATESKQSLTQEALETLSRRHNPLKRVKFISIFRSPQLNIMWKRFSHNPLKRVKFISIKPM